MKVGVRLKKHIRESFLTKPEYYKTQIVLLSLTREDDRTICVG